MTAKKKAKKWFTSKEIPSIEYAMTCVPDEPIGSDLEIFLGEVSTTGRFHIEDEAIELAEDIANMELRLTHKGELLFRSRLGDLLGV